MLTARIKRAPTIWRPDITNNLTGLEHAAIKRAATVGFRFTGGLFALESPRSAKPQIIRLEHRLSSAVGETKPRTDLKLWKFHVRQCRVGSSSQQLVIDKKISGVTNVASH
ncbi:hypothetical protein CDV31_005995 [Fusarium ambrosium]|uniref:Uncharacterized protein n=1 Tax=Fusarium ambrosium TaxID=131363 RepID=A0A428UFN5_9HYPO|nr:hypothetical protein CDV31_005995 [Fusarium ambrosium]